MVLNIQKDYDLSSANSLRLKCIAARYLEINSVDELNEFLAVYSAQKNKQRLFVLGEGSNVVFPEYFSGTILRPKLPGIEIVKEENDSVHIKVAAGENWHNFVQYTIERGFYGLENLSLIPGSVGAAPIQNIGAYSVEVCECIESVEVYNFKENELQVLSNKDCRFSYRESVFKKNPEDYLVLSVIFKLSKKEVLNLSYKALKIAVQSMQENSSGFIINQKSLSQLVCDIRREKLPDVGVIANAGSFFKNPVVSEKQYQDLKKNHPGLVAFPQDDFSRISNLWKLSAAWLIDVCGWKGKVEGKVGVYQKHALVLITKGESCQQELLAFASSIQQDVNKTFGVNLVIEPVIVV